MSIGFFILFGALILTVGGAGLIYQSIRIRREAIGRRVDAIKPGLPAAAKSTKSKSGRDVPLMRLKSQGFAQQEEREIIRLMSKLGIPQESARSSFAIARSGSTRSDCAAERSSMARSSTVTIARFSRLASATLRSRPIRAGCSSAWKSASSA